MIKNEPQCSDLVKAGDLAPQDLVLAMFHLFRSKGDGHGR